MKFVLQISFIVRLLLVSYVCDTCGRGVFLCRRDELGASDLVYRLSASGFVSVRGADGMKFVLQISFTVRLLQVSQVCETCERGVFV